MIAENKMAGKGPTFAKTARIGHPNTLLATKR